MLHLPDTLAHPTNFPPNSSMTSSTSDNFISDRDWGIKLMAERYLDTSDGRWGYLEACQNDAYTEVTTLDLLKGCDEYSVVFDSATGHPRIVPGNEERHYRFKLQPEPVGEAWKITLRTAHKGGTAYDRPILDGDEINLGRYRYKFCDTINPKPNLKGVYMKYDVVPDSQVIDGGNGSVQKVFVRGQPQTHFAVKIIVPKRGSKLTYEISALKALNHPNVCRLEEVFSIRDGTLHLVMKYAKGTLGNIYEDRSPSVFSSNAQASKHSFDMISRSIMRQICTAMKYVHSCGIMHRDIKPHNILVISLSPFT